MKNAFYSCPTLSLLHVLGKRWTIPILEVLRSPCRKMQFNTIQLLLEGITPKNLSKSLKELSKAHVIKKTEIKNRGTALRTEYSLTEKGTHLVGFVKSAKKLGISMYGIDAACAKNQCYKCAMIKTPTRGIAIQTGYDT